MIISIEFQTWVIEFTEMLQHCRWRRLNRVVICKLIINFANQRK